MDEEMLKARQKYFESATKLAQANDCAIIIGETTTKATDEVKEIVTRDLQNEFRNACKEYYDVLCKLKEVIWNEYMKTFKS